VRRGVPILLVMLVLGGCSGSSTPKASKAFCVAADKYNNEIERTIKRGEVDAERQAELGAELARTAPASIKHDAKVFADALRRVADDPSIRDDPDVKEAVDNVNRLANQACGVYDRKSGI
jgi:hypothetical protein